MSNKVININGLSVSSIDKALREVEKFKKRLEQNTIEFIDRLADYAVGEATLLFREAYYAGDVRDVFIEKQPSGELSRMVIARGDAVLFIEFGTGVYMPDSPEERASLVDGSGIVMHGEYGRKQGANPNGWWFKDKPLTGTIPFGTLKQKDGWVHTMGNPANSSLYYTVSATKERADQIAREVFK